jgi:predicted small metal-binding protein
MKQLKCSEMGGPATCDTMIKGANADELISSGWQHIQEAHPEMAEGIKNNPKEVNDKWQADFKVKVDALPEM